VPARSPGRSIAIERKRFEAQLAERANLDSLTGLEIARFPGSMVHALARDGAVVAAPRFYISTWTD